MKQVAVSGARSDVDNLKCLVWIRILQHLKMYLIMYLDSCINKTHLDVLSHVSISLILAYRLYKYSAVSKCSFANALEKVSWTEPDQ
jgi:hypothetical protein